MIQISVLMVNVNESVIRRVSNICGNDIFMCYLKDAEKTKNLLENTHFDAVVVEYYENNKKLYTLLKDIKRKGAFTIVNSKKGELEHDLIDKGLIDFYISSNSHLQIYMLLKYIIKNKKLYRKHLSLRNNFEKFCDALLTCKNPFKNCFDTSYIN